MKIYGILFKFIVALLSIPLVWLLGTGLEMENRFQILSIIGMLLIGWTGAFCAGKTEPLKLRLSVFASALLCIPSIYRLVGRMLFVMENNDLEGPDGYGSPMAFVIVALIEMVLLIPMVVLLIYGALLMFFRKVKILFSG